MQFITVYIKKWLVGMMDGLTARAIREAQLITVIFPSPPLRCLSGIDDAQYLWVFSEEIYLRKMVADHFLNKKIFNALKP